jgi:replicative DNA helicase Mcm
MSEHILDLHRRGSMPTAESPITPQLLRKYISYAKNIKPVLSEPALQRLKDFYLEMRHAGGESEASPIAITARQLESLVRIAEARARVALRKEILAEDAEAAVNIMKRSLTEVGIDMTTGKTDIDLIYSGKPKSMRDRLTIILSTIVEMEKDTGIVDKAALIDKLTKERDVTAQEAERLLQQLEKDGTIYRPREGYIKKT